MSDLGRWTSVDPQADKYFDLSPLVYVANNPIKFIDPNGEEIVAAQGNMNAKQFAQFKTQVLTNLQSLTNDQLAWKGNTLIITKLGGANSGKNLSAGTKLIRSQNNKQAGHKTTTIELTTGGNRTRGKSSKVNKNANGTNGAGDDATVEFNPNKQTGGTDVNGSNNRPTEIGLGHELIHADSMNKGERDTSSSGKQDGDTSKKRILSKEEYNTRVKENKLRKEQGVPARKI